MIPPCTSDGIEFGRRDAADGLEQPAMVEPFDPLQRGFKVTRETTRAWEFRFGTLLANQLRAKRRRSAAVPGYMYDTCPKLAGRGCSPYCAIDRLGDLLGFMLRGEHRGKPAARRFLKRLVEVAGREPQRVTGD